MLPTDVPVLSFAAASEFEAWLEEHHAEPGGILIKFAKAGTGIASITYPEAVEAALCFGWIDGQSKRLDDTYWVQRFTPRRPRSMWSRINRDKALALIAAGRMRPAGLREVERAQADGRWERAYAGPATAEVPPELASVLENDPQAAAFFAGLDKTNRYAYIHRFQQAKRPETRAKLVAGLREGRLLHQRRPSRS